MTADDSIDQRLALVEQKLDAVAEQLADVRADVRLVQATMATKSELAETKASILMWVVGSVFLVQLLPPLIKADPIGAAFSVFRYVQSIPARVSGRP